jgi:ergothioneine biosynthesis protein EgtB
VNERLFDLLNGADEERLSRIEPPLVLGLHHEQQHQELLLTDVKHLFAGNPLRPAYREGPAPARGPAAPLRWLDYPAGLRCIGHDGDGFAYDNEGPRHRQYVASFQLGSRLVTNADYLAFMADGGYERPELWLSDGWNARSTDGWRAPLYWEERDGRWQTFTLAGMREIHEAEPVCHVSYYEADAFARWAGARLPTEAEWETAAQACPMAGNLLAGGALHPLPLGPEASDRHPGQMFGDAWEWTASPYVPYPGYRPAAGALGEYNGKFMCNQLVLRGGSCVTPPGHIRPTYRNFFPPDARWQFTGLRLARDS